MTIYFPNTDNLVCDTMTIHDGLFLFDSSCLDQDKIQLNRISGATFCSLKNIDWELHRKNYNRSIYSKRNKKTRFLMKRPQ